MSNISNDLTTLDFEHIKNNLKEYMRSQPIFKDYDFEASNINVLLDVLSYNTYMNSFYLNMIGNEMFLDSALLRDSVISHAKELNYVPRSFRSARASVQLTISDSTFPSNFLIPKGTSFTGTSGSEDYTFVVDENILVPRVDNVYKTGEITIHEGAYVKDSYVINYNDKQNYVITNKTADVNSITVTVLEDNGAIALDYTKAENLFGLDSRSQVFFIQGIHDDRYEIIFGDNVIGRKPKDRSVVIIEYRKTNGELPNGIKIFRSNGKIGDGVVLDVKTIKTSHGGSIPESIEEIKFNAPRAFTTQERAVSATDYETLLLKNYSEINAASAYGGEEMIPPQYGKVVVAIDLKTSDEVPPILKREYERFLRNKTPLSIDPIFVKPEYTYIQVLSKVKYDINKSSININDLRYLVFSQIQEFNKNNLNAFRKTLYYSKLIGSIDDTHISIVSNDTEVYAIKLFTPKTIESGNYVVDFGMELKDDIPKLNDIHPDKELTVIYSSPFIFNGIECYIEDNGDGLLRIVTSERGSVKKIKDIGFIDYEKGILQINNFRPTRLLGSKDIKIYSRVMERDINSQRNAILSIRDEDIHINVEQVRL